MNDILDSPVTQQATLRYAGFWIRFAAHLIDYIIVSIANSIIGAIFGIGAVGMNFSGSNPEDVFTPAFIAGMFSMFAMMFVLNIIYYTVMESSVRQATVGKMALGLKVGDANGNRISAANALGRTLSKIISALILYIGYMMAGWDSKKQSLHDKIAGTYVFYAS